MSIEKGMSFATREVIKYLGSDKCDEINDFVLKASGEEFAGFTSLEEINSILSPIVDSYYEKLSEEDIASLRSYTGYDFRNINNIMRNKWNYEENGLLTAEKKNEYRLKGDTIYRIINRLPSLNMNIKAYRGVSIKAFWDYDIHSLDDLKAMEGRFLYEEGFQSTSLLRENSFFEKELGWGDRHNIEIEYFIPAECRDGVLLLNDSLSYSTNQVEFLINSGSLTKITNVEIDTENNRAYLKAVLIPRPLWDPMQLEDAQIR